MGATAVRKPVTGIIELEDWAELLGEKKSVIEKLRDKREALDQARAARKEENAQKRDEKIDKKIRDKIIKETFAALGKDENFIENQHKWINEQRGSGTPTQEGSVSELDRALLIAKGALISAKADKREKRNKIIESGKDLTKLLLPALALKASAVLSQTFIAPVILPATAGVIIFKLVQTLKRKDKSIASNLADANEKLDACEEALKQFEEKMQVVEAALLNAKDKLTKDYKSMNKKEFDALLLKTIVATLCSAGLLTEEEAMNKTGVEDIKELMGFSQLPNEEESLSEAESETAEEKEQEETDLEGTELEETNLEGTELEETNLEEKDLEEIDLEEIDLEEIDLEKIEIKEKTEEEKAAEQAAKEAERKAAEQAAKEAREQEEYTELGGE